MGANGVESIVLRSNVSFLAKLAVEGLLTINPFPLEP